MSPATVSASELAQGRLRQPEADSVDTRLKEVRLPRGGSARRREQRADERAGGQALNRDRRQAVGACPRLADGGEARGMGRAALQTQDLDVPVHVEQVDEVTAPGGVP